ncbi:MAG: hypothetical protein ACE5PV_26200 [Candidatus Poribacteria bacterium]
MEEFISAIDKANITPEGDVINLNGGISKVNKGGGTDGKAGNGSDDTGPNGLPCVTSKIVINGNGATIERLRATGTPDFRIFEVTSTGNLTLYDLTIQNGRIVAPNGGANGGGGGSFGGGIFNNGGTVKLQLCFRLHSMNL